MSIRCIAFDIKEMYIAFDVKKIIAFVVNLMYSISCQEDVYILM